MIQQRGPMMNLDEGLILDPLWTPFARPRSNGHVSESATTEEVQIILRRTPPYHFQLADDDPRSQNIQDEDSSSANCTLQRSRIKRIIYPQEHLRIAFENSPPHKVHSVVMCACPCMQEFRLKYRKHFSTSPLLSASWHASPLTRTSFLLAVMVLANGKGRYRSGPTTVWTSHRVD